MRILIVFRLPKGGLFRHVMNLLEGFYRKGYHVGVVFDKNSYITNELEDCLRQYAVLGVFRIPITRLPSLNDFYVVRKILKLVDSLDIDIIHGHGSKGGLYSRLVAKLSRYKKAKAVYTLHGGSLHYTKKSIQGILYLSIEKQLLPFTTGIIYESEFTHHCFQKKIGNPTCNIKVIFNGLYKSEYERIIPSSSAADFIFIGELRKLKGVDILLRAIHIIQSRGYSPTLNIFGTGPDHNHFREIEKKLNIKNIQWKGLAKNAREALVYGRCLIIPSLAESLPYIILESVAMGVPVLATNVGGIPEILGERDNWIIPGNANDLADKMLEYLNCNINIHNNVDELHNRVKSLFDADRMVDNTLAFYRTCMTK